MNDHMIEMPAAAYALRIANETGLKLNETRLFTAFSGDMRIHKFEINKWNDKIKKMHDNTEYLLHEEQQ